MDFQRLGEIARTVDERLRKQTLPTGSPPVSDEQRVLTELGPPREHGCYQRGVQRRGVVRVRRRRQLQTAPELLWIQQRQTRVHDLEEYFHEIEGEPMGRSEGLVSDDAAKISCRSRRVLGKLSAREQGLN